VRAAAAAKPKVKAQAAKTSPKPQLQQKSAALSRAEGTRLYQLAGRPTQEQLVAVYGPKGPAMTWTQRAAAGVPAEKFQGALASAVRGQQ
jgi:hypothetical protein